MPQCKTTRGKTSVTLYKSERSRWEQVIDDLAFVERNVEPGAIKQEIARQAGASLKLLLDGMPKTPERKVKADEPVDEPADEPAHGPDQPKAPAAKAG